VIFQRKLLILFALISIGQNDQKYIFLSQILFLNHSNIQLYAFQLAYLHIHFILEFQLAFAFLHCTSSHQAHCVFRNIHSKVYLIMPKLFYHFSTQEYCRIKLNFSYICLSNSNFIDYFQASNLFALFNHVFFP